MDTDSNEKIMMALYEMQAGTGKNVQFSLQKDTNEFELGVALAGIIDYAERNQIDFEEVVETAMDILESEEKKDSAPSYGRKLQMLN